MQKKGGAQPPSFYYPQIGAINGFRGGEFSECNGKAKDKEK